MIFKRNNYPHYLAEKVNAHVQRCEQLGGRNPLHGLNPTSSSLKLISNDYLALANHSKILAAQRKELASFDNMIIMSSVYLHGDNAQLNFEQRMADFMGSEEAVLCQSGYNANIGLVQAIVQGADVPIYLDMMAHMSMRDGTHFSKAAVYSFRHNNIDHLMSLIERHGPGLVMVDSVYSTNGSVCPLKALVDAAYEKGCLLLVDESHSLGTLGPQGRGLVVEYGLQDKVMFRTASLAKAFAGRAGIITCPKGFADYFKCTANPSIFSSGLLSYEIAGLNATLDLIIRADDRRDQLWRNADYLRQALSNLGYNVDASQSQIIGLEAGSERQTTVLKDALESRDVFGSVFCAPATAKNRALVRLSVNAGLTGSQLEQVVEVFKGIREEVGLNKWRSTYKSSLSFQQVS
ncbi:alpha-hydroxyketone-type quorum-sensing autoinducer synthase [Marinomonas posidonica]|uniref:8-amino-7-oxononanoate synthase n=1 Tax=Marinomonas posidonica (strain CECT 7376 / NCIMB 14433 / IVIA-Po-181) TaxID=491952 RepID=F6CUV2_MARPP|nr:alpha-hydroxyketone-type quorum-sensing autoinducer synthase [Marinomonas posidonica]AEF55278.1 8-amino-7-oxononanoate synthase [Marinomonas posidonica IVIA-Po-181]